MQRTTTFKRMMSAFLAIILLLGITPSIPLSAFAAENGMPDTISYIKTEFGINGDVGLTADSNGAKYHSSHLGGTVYVQDFQMKANGETVHGFYFDHTKHLDNKEPYVSDTWTYSKKIEKDDIANYPFLPFLDYYYWELENGTDQFTLAVHRMYAQSAIWLTVNNKQFASPYDDASLQLLIDERNAYFASLDDSQVPRIPRLALLSRDPMAMA